MKAPPKRKGNHTRGDQPNHATSLNESPSEKEGKFVSQFVYNLPLIPSMKVPPKRKGNPSVMDASFEYLKASMKALPKRKGNVIIL